MARVVAWRNRGKTLLHDIYWTEGLFPLRIPHKNKKPRTRCRGLDTLFYVLSILFYKFMLREIFNYFCFLLTTISFSPSLPTLFPGCSLLSTFQLDSPLTLVHSQKIRRGPSLRKIERRHVLLLPSSQFYLQCLAPRFTASR